MAQQRYLLLDTNIWLSAYLATRPNHDEVLQLLTQACKCGVELLYPVHASKDLFFLVANDLKRAYRQEHGHLDEAAAVATNAAAWGCVNHMAELATAVPCDHADVWMAQKQRGLHNDFEDDLVIAAALRSKCDLLVTEDAALREHACVAVASVADAMHWIKAVCTE